MGLGKSNAGRLTDTDRLVGFCLLIRREVVDSIGLLDERFGLGCFEDDDYCLRAMQVGYRTVIARDAFVHHFGGRTFVGTGVDFQSLMQKNEGLFREKWAKAEATQGAARRSKSHRSPNSTRSVFAPRVACWSNASLSSSRSV